MNYVKQAFELSNVKKELAAKIYSQAVSEIVNKNYVMRVIDAHTELSAIFGVLWLAKNRKTGNFCFDWDLYAEANVAFNYANFNYGINGRFVDYAMKLVAADERVSDEQLNVMAGCMDSILTATTGKVVSKRMQYA